MLVDKSESGTPVPHHLAVGRFQLPEQQLQERCLSIAILTDQYDSRCASYSEAVWINAHSSEEWLGRSWIAEGNVLRLDDDAADAAPCVQHQRKVCVLLQGGQLLGVGGRLLVKLLEALLPREVAGVACRGLPRPDVLEQLLALVRPYFTLAFTCSLLFAPHSGPRRIVTTGVRQPPSNATDVQHVSACPVNEESVVRDHHHSARLPDLAMRELVAQPQHCLHAQMICGLVQQEYVRLGKERSCQGNAHPPTAAECLQSTGSQLITESQV
mmetsp:Transcript_10056/g.28376  ORF Transcript_10056/g.28376 Transcript_10056/m.28376 type:complete len:270 (+) Transcript_10056:647-1456(+)